MKVQSTQIAGVLIVEPDFFGDDRGFFLENFNERKMREIGINAHFVQDNHSCSQGGVLRGLHYQISQPQGKLVRAVSGSVFDVAVDIRRNSPTFGKWVGVELSEENKRMFWLPAGMAHGFVVCRVRRTFFTRRPTIMRRSLNVQFCGTIRTWAFNGRWRVSRSSPQRMRRVKPFAMRKCLKQISA